MMLSEHKRLMTIVGGHNVIYDSKRDRRSLQMYRRETKAYDHKTRWVGHLMFDKQTHYLESKRYKISK